MKERDKPSFLARLMFSPNQKSSGLQNKQHLLQRNAEIRKRLELEVELTKKLRATIKTLTERAQADQSDAKFTATRDRSAKMVERVAGYVHGTLLELPRNDFEEFKRKCFEGNPEMAGPYLTALQADGNLALYQQLFAQEMAMGQGFNFNRLEPAISFMRGKSDVELAEKRKESLSAQKTNLIKKQKARFDRIIKDEFIDPKKVNSICEVGAAWGATTRCLLDRYKPKIYHSYEIDAGWAEWLQDNLNLTSMPCDGESLASTDDGSMDMCMASSCLYFMPYMKQWNYLTEMARVLRPGGVAVVNVLLVENLGVRNLKAHFEKHFPRRAFGHLPKHCLDTAFPASEFEQLVDDPAKFDHTYVFRKL